ncbi:DUF2790 domain-containing protein [Pseudomonas sp. TH31]|uniref:DUF2790 domain-containing protein n=1 Tax=Pseudomonas sp. TH31 TaxID=2796396 RepID=UPI00191361DC|nr:DUF2790 domain-containing protein [Pseudomonas sp. TH31]MBK5417197.1 DUF2790 domain-containing protein [Pseudomonas sp. TH31]
MKILLTVVFSSLCVTAIAEEHSTEIVQQPTVNEYNYSTRLDVAKIISTSEIPYVCGVVPMQMEYEDSKDQRHILNYSVMGNGCSNG